MQIPTKDRLTELGFVTAAHEMEKHKELATPGLREKLRIAFEFYRVVEPEQLQRFSDKLKRDTKKRTVTVTRDALDRKRIQTDISWMKPVFTRIHNYTAAPPVEVLEKMEEAKNRKCFDYYEIMTLGLHQQTSVRLQHPDPILFGRIDNSENLYFIAQWDDDVKIEDILSEEEG